jgi:hypothetical protein
MQVEGKENLSTTGNSAAICDDPLVKKQSEKLGHDAGVWASYCSRMLTPADALAVLRAV